MEKSTIHISGMHCRSCEILIEDELLKIPCVEKVAVSEKKGLAEIYYNGNLDKKRVENAVLEAGYTLGIDKKPWFATDPKMYIDVLKAAIILFVLYSIANLLGIFDLASNFGGSYSSLSVVLIVGLTAGISTCMALVGGLILGISARFSEKHPGIDSVGKFKPHLFFNLGRVLSFFILGGVIGFAGSVLQFSLSTMGLLTIGVGLVMLTLGLQLMEISPKISKFNFTLPKGISRFLGIKESADKEYSHRNSMILGALTFFLPCGFTQAMQLYAMSTGSVLAGSLTMGVFALGTVPGLLGVGGLTSVIKGASSRLFFKTVGLAVAVLAVYNMGNGYNLSGLDVSALSPIEINLAGNSETYDSAGDAGSVPVALGTAGGCGGGAAAGAAAGGGCGGGSGCGGCGGAKKPSITGNSAQVAAQIEGSTQVLKATFSNNDGMVPANFSVKSGQPVRLEVTAKEDGYGCMGSIAVPKLSKQVDIFQKDKTNVFEFTPKSPGTYQITCAMGIPHGEIRVN